MPPSSRARSFIPFSSSGKCTLRSWAIWGKHPRRPEAATPTRQVARLPGARGAAPLAHPPSSSNFIPSKLTAKLALVAAAELSGAARLASARSRAETGSPGGLSGSAGPHGVAGQVSQDRRSPLAARAPRSQAGQRGVDPSARGHARERRRSFLQLRNSSRLSLAAGLGVCGSGAVTPRYGSEIPCGYSSQLLARRRANTRGDLAALQGTAWGSLWRRR